MEKEYFKGRGAQTNTSNKFHVLEYVTDHIEGIDEPLLEKKKTQIYYEYPKKIINKVTSPDIPLSLSMNPYQGCEHGCIYCYARNTHEFWGFSAGMDFESKIIAKPEAPNLLEKTLLKKNWEVKPIMLSGNTDCYQPLEKKLELTRKMLQVLVKYQHPVGIITKNSLILRDSDILAELAKNNLVSVFISITSLDESLRRVLEPRTASAAKRLHVISSLTKLKVPVGVMVAPIIPGLNNQEIPRILEKSADNGALTAAMTMVRLNGAIQHLFKDWLAKNFPDRFNKVWHQIMEVHDGKVNDSEWGRRMKGSGELANTIHGLFKTSHKKYFSQRAMPPLDPHKFRRQGMMNLF